MTGYKCLNCGFKFIHPDTRVIYRPPSSRELSWDTFLREIGLKVDPRKSDKLPKIVRKGYEESYYKWRRKKLEQLEPIVVNVCPNCGSDAIVEIELSEL